MINALTYNIDVPASGVYDIVARVASPGEDTKQLGITVGNQTQSILEFDPTGGWQKWESIPLEDLSLSVGLQELRLDFLTSGFNLNYISLYPKTTIV